MFAEKKKLQLNAYIEFFCINRRFTIIRVDCILNAANELRNNWCLAKHAQVFPTYIIIVALISTYIERNIEAA